MNCVAITSSLRSRWTARRRIDVVRRAFAVPFSSGNGGGGHGRGRGGGRGRGEGSGSDGGSGAYSRFVARRVGRRLGAEPDKEAVRGRGGWSGRGGGGRGHGGRDRGGRGSGDGRGRGGRGRGRGDPVAAARRAREATESWSVAAATTTTTREDDDGGPDAYDPDDPFEEEEDEKEGWTVGKRWKQDIDNYVYDWKDPNNKEEEEEEEEEEETVMEEDARYNPDYQAHLPYDERYNEYGAKPRDLELGFEIDGADEDEDGGAGQHPEKYYFTRDILDFSDPFPELPEEHANRVVPLADHGPEFDDFLAAMLEHPTKYASVEHVRVHPESRRLPLPVVPAERRRNCPPKEWVKSHKGFLHVENVTVDHDNNNNNNDDDGDKHQRALVAAVRELFPDVDKSSQIHPTSAHSAFVGFNDKAKARRAKALLTSTTTTTENGPRVLLARRDRVFRQFGGWANDRIIYKRNHVLAVEGDQPSPEFFLSHFGVLHVETTDDDDDDDAPLLTKNALTRFFQPLCDEVRDPHGSVEIGPCGRTAFVGFDRWGEAERTLKALAENADELAEVDDDHEDYETIDGNRAYTIVTVFTSDSDSSLPLLLPRRLRLRPVLEQKLPHGTRLGPRGDRHEAALLDDLHNWEKHVDPEKLKFLYEHGIERQTLDEVFVKARYANPSFGPVDQTLKGDRLEPQVPIGSRYPAFVRQYVRELVASVTTPEDPGLAVESLFSPDETVDLRQIDRAWYKDEEKEDGDEKRIADGGSRGGGGD